MIFKFTLLSDELDDFVRVISINSDASFLDLHNAILDSVQYEKNLLTTFFLCSDDWEKEQEITLIEMDTTSEYDNLIMEETILEDMLEDEKQKLLFVFDILSERMFFIELSEMLSGSNPNVAKCIKSLGDPPKQTLLEDDLFKEIQIDIDKEFYGDEDFDISEIDDFNEDDFDNTPNIDDSGFY